MGQGGPNAGVLKLWNHSQDMPTLLLGGHSLGVVAANSLAYSPRLPPLPLRHHSLDPLHCGSPGGTPVSHHPQKEFYSLIKTWWPTKESQQHGLEDTLDKHQVQNDAGLNVKKPSSRAGRHSPTVCFWKSHLNSLNFRFVLGGVIPQPTGWCGDGIRTSILEVL